MAELQAHYRISVDRMKPLAAEPGTGHNRWHPEVTPILRVREGDVVALETRDVSDGQIGPDTTRRPHGHTRLAAWCWASSPWSGGRLV